MNENHHNVSGINLKRLKEKVKFYMEKVSQNIYWKKKQEMFFDSFVQLWIY